LKKIYPTIEFKKMTPVKLVVGLLSNQRGRFSRIKIMLEKRYGPVDFVSPLLDFNHTRYYESEFGPDLKRIFYSFKKPLKNKNLETVKLYCRKLESRFSIKNKRVVNIDPGYVTAGKLILFTTKNYSHRIFLGKGIFAEVTLKYEKGSFSAWPWTYPDYRTRDYINFFTEVRSLYMKQIKHD